LVSRKLRHQPPDRFTGPLTDPGGSFGSALFEIGEASPQAEGVELVDGKYADAALCASRTAEQPFSTSAGGFGQCGVHDLDQFLIAASWKTAHHGLLIMTRSPWFEHTPSLTLPQSRSTASRLSCSLVELGEIARGAPRWLALRSTV
jgi:hypothetical protein